MLYIEIFNTESYEFFNGLEENSHFNNNKSFKQLALALKIKYYFM